MLRSFATMACFVGIAAASNPSPNGAAISATLRAEAARTSVQLLLFVDAVRAQYYRDVSRAELLDAAMTAMYEAARQPLPANLRAQLEQAQGPDLERLLVELRVSLGDQTSLRGMNGLLVAIGAMPRALDPHCGLIPDRDRIISGRTAEPSEDPRHDGIGIEFADAPLPVEVYLGDNRGRLLEVSPLLNAGNSKPVSLPSVLVVKSVVPGSPAQQMGLRPGDQIVTLNGRPCSEMEVMHYYRVFYPAAFPGDPPGRAESVAVDVRRPGRSEIRSLTLRAATYRPESVFGIRRQPDGTWDFLLDRASKFAYVRVGQITMATANDFARMISIARSQEANGLILDLRWCPGGYLGQAVTLTKTLLAPELPVATLINRERRQIPPEQVPLVIEPCLTIPVVVLVNGDTTGGGEMIAAALQDHGRATIVGERTFGKGTVQHLLAASSVPIPISFKISESLLKRPNGKLLQRHRDSKPTDNWGVQPDPGKFLPLSPEVSRQLKEWWTWQALRPADNFEPIPTDDPEADPQLRAALQILHALPKKES